MSRNLTRAIQTHTISKVYVNHAIDQIREYSPVLSEMEANGYLLIAAAMNDIVTGKAEFYD